MLNFRVFKIVSSVDLLDDCRGRHSSQTTLSKGTLLEGTALRMSVSVSERLNSHGASKASQGLGSQPSSVGALLTWFPCVSSLPLGQVQLEIHAPGPAAL